MGGAGRARPRVPAVRTRGGRWAREETDADDGAAPRRRRPCLAALAVLTLAFSGTGCGHGSGRHDAGAHRDHPPGHPAHGKAAAGNVASPHVASPHGSHGPPPIAVRVTHVTGSVTELGTQDTLHQGATLPAGSVLETGSDGAITLDWRLGGHVAVGADSRVRVGGEAPAELVVGRGGVRAVLAPTGNSARPPLRIGTPAGTVVIGGTGDVWVEVLADGTSWIAVLGGQCAVQQGGADADGQPVAHPFVAGQAVRFGPGDRPPGSPSTAPGRLEAAGAQGAALAAKARARSAAARKHALLTTATALEAVVGSLEQARAESLKLEAAQRAVARTDANKARALLGRLVASGQTRERQSMLVRTRWERLEAEAMAAGVSGDGDPVGPRRARVRAALGLP